MKQYTIFRTPNFPNTYLVLEAEADPRKIVPFNLLYLAGEPQPSKVAVSPSYLPFAAGGRRHILGCVDEAGYCFYRWPGKVLGLELGDVLHVPEPEPAAGPDPETGPDAGTAPEARGPGN